MITALKPYPAMKDSGVEWLGDVPEGWEVRPVARVGQLLKGNGGSKDDEVPDGIPCVRYGDLYTRHEFFIRSTKACVTEERAADYTPIRRGDVLFAASGETIEEIGRSAVNLMKTEARCGGDILLLRPMVELLPEFAGYAADSPPVRHQKSCMGRGFTVVHIYGSQLRRLVIPLPPLPEQASIVRFLDYYDRRIRRYIRAKQKLIKLLEEEKQAIIHRAVTGQIDVRTGKPYPRYKPSGVEWLGDVPEGWEVRRFKRCVRFAVGQVDPRISPYHSIILIAPEHLEKRTGKILEMTSAADQGAISGKYIAEQGEVIYSKIRPALRKAAVAPCRCLCSADMYPLAPVSEELHAPYLLLILLSDPFTRYAVDCSMRVAMPKVNRDALSACWLSYPTLAEQDAILAYVSDTTAPLNTTISRTACEIALLREYRTRLVADVVTGKLDVRAAAAALPDEPDEADEPEQDAGPDEEMSDGEEEIPQELDGSDR